MLEFHLASSLCWVHFLAQERRLSSHPPVLYPLSLPLFRSMITQVLSAEVCFINQPFLTPMHLSTGPIYEVTEARVTVKVKVDGREGVGIGAILLSDLWSWPDLTLSHEVRDGRMRDLCQQIAENLVAWSEPAAHPIALGIRLHNRLCREESDIPVLARAVCLSPFDAAIHDAVGQALERSAFSFYDEPQALPEADHLFVCGNAFQAIKQCLTAPKDHLDAWWIIGAADVLPDALKKPVLAQGYRAVKVKLLAKDPEQDLSRIIEIHDSLRSLGVTSPRLSVDTNEGNKNADEVSHFLATLRQRRPDVFDSLEYLEQPTSRNILAHRHNWKGASALKPILMDEGLTDLSLLKEAKEQGWGGFALKTCKGHSFALLVAAWAHEQGLPLAMQDLTNPGYAAIHSYLFAAHLDTINGIELNSPQYIPQGNEPWLPRLQDFFNPANGKHRLPDAPIIGLGSRL